MQQNKKKRWIIAVSAILAAAILIGVIIILILPSKSERFFEGEAEAYYQSLLAKGFPSDYAAELTELHLLHPEWEFEPLLVTGQNSAYTWDYVIEQETESGDRNVIYADSEYRAYHHPFNKELYDSGYYQASGKAVQYFMDPRNFLNEIDIFQFYSLEFDSSVSQKAVEAVLSGTFMENAKLENGKTYAAYIMEVGRELDLNPIFLAAKIRTEQGVGGTSPIISGACGDRLWSYYQNKTQTNEQGDAVLTPTDETFTQSQLTAYNGYYNFFNVGATGKGLFAIYKNAMTRAITGTPDMASSWGNGGAWNTKWKSIYGGAYLLKKQYVDNYQSTVYLQKFNVDSRSNGNFWKQYMTAVFGAMNEGRTLCQSFTALDALDMPATFRIPVYGDMPSEPCADPAGGAVKSYAVATDRYSYEVSLSEPERYVSENAPIYLETEVYPKDPVTVSGKLTHTYSLDALEYAWDGGAWNAFSSENDWELSLTHGFSENTLHILVIRARMTYTTSGKTIHTYSLVSVIYVDIVPVPRAKLSIDVNGRTTSMIYDVGTSVRLPACEDAGFAGWYGSDGSFLPSGASLTLQEDVTYSAVYLTLTPLSGASLRFSSDAPQLCFSAVTDTESYELLTQSGSEYLTFTATLSDENGTHTGNVSIGSIAHRDGEDRILLDTLTPTLSGAALDRTYFARFAAELRYSDGTNRTLSEEAISASRSAKAVATAALSDKGVTYSESLFANLRAILENT